MALSKIDVANMLTGATPIANGGTGLTANALTPRSNPIIYNGNQSVAQRGTSSTGISSGGYYTIDRWTFSMANTAGRLTSEQIADGPAGTGLVNCTKLTCTTADTSIASNEILQFQQKLEGQDIQEFCKGTSDAKKFTVAFYVKGNASATYTCELHDRDNTRYNGQEFAVTTSWNRIVLVFNADTTGAFDDDNAVSVSLNFNLHGGSDYTGGTFSSNTWHTTANQRFGDNQTSFFDSTDRTFFITGIQMEVGEFTSTTIPPFQHESFEENLKRCQRYYYKLKNDSGSATGAYWGNSIVDSSTTLKGTIRFPKMRTVPSAFETTGTASDYRVWTSGNTSTVCSSVPTLDQITSFSGRLLFTVSSGLTAGQVGGYRSSTTDAYLAWSAEL
jgi:hypothetical protein